MSYFNELYVNTLHTGDVTVGDRSFTATAVIKNTSGGGTITGTTSTVLFQKVGNIVTMTFTLNSGAGNVDTLDSATTYYLDTGGGTTSCPAEFRPAVQVNIPYSYDKGGHQLGTFAVTTAGLLRFANWNNTNFGTGDVTRLGGSYSFSWYKA